MNISKPAHWLAQLDVERASACITWMVISGSALYFLEKHFSLLHWRTLSAGFIFLLLAVCFVLLSSEKRSNSSNSLRRFALLGVMYALAIGSQLVVPYSYLAIFVVIWSAILPYYVPWKRCLVLSVPVAIPTALIQANLWHEQQAVLTGALFWTFNLFAMIMSNTAIKEARAREDADALNRQLSSTQQLMKQALTQDERLRIARNIHDVLGHHLTALTINLQVASRKISMLEGKDPQDIKKHVEQSHSIAKLLLSDVREAVSDIRENAAINFSDAVHALVEELPRPRVTLHIDDNLSLTNVSIADCLLRCMQEALTNVIKHSSAQYFVISLQQREGSYYLCLQDSCVPSEQSDSRGANNSPEAHLTNLEEANNIHNAHVTPGNGLKGMQERVSALGGHITWQQREQGFQIDIQIPEVE